MRLNDKAAQAFWAAYNLIYEQCEGTLKDAQDFSGAIGVFEDHFALGCLLIQDQFIQRKSSAEDL
ncbi:hypothetical protein GCM10023213_08240 [Prosthecobacter algae]|uniref:HEPN domain-containing protein n=1 Tax=Prosthecobacter algae TaxID=1144682 RepID=A0ABP9NWU6_9BACT